MIRSSPQPAGSNERWQASSTRTVPGPGWWRLSRYSRRRWPPPGFAGDGSHDDQLVRPGVDRQRSVGGDDHDVLDPGSPPPREIDPRFDAESHALGERQIVAGDDVGSSCTDRPMPCPVRCTKYSARPASASTSRAAASICWAVIPGRTASTITALARCSTAYRWAISGTAHRCCRCRCSRRL